jgi:hypothetical protein
MSGVWMHKIRKKNFGTDLAVFSLACIVLYAFSVFYGLVYSPNYSVAIYRLMLGKLADGHWAWGMAVLAGAMLAVMFAWLRLLTWPTFVKTITLWIQPRIIIIFLIIFGGIAVSLSLYKVYLLGYTQTYADHGWLGVRWKLSGIGLEAFYRSSALNWIIYSSPFLVFLGTAALLRLKHDFKLAFLLVVPLAGLSVYIVSNPILPYQYYYARYLLTESVPYVIVAFVIATIGNGNPRWRKLGIAAVAVSAVWFGFITIKQFGAEEGKRPLSVLQAVAAHVDTGDVLLIEKSGWSIPRFGVETPLRFYFGLKTVALPEEVRRKHARQIAGLFRNVWLLSPKPVQDDQFILHDRLLHYDRVMRRVGHVPLKVVNNFWNQELYLYVMKKWNWPSSRGIPFQFDKDHYDIEHGSSEVSFILGAGWQNLERTHVWSTASAEITLDRKTFPNGALPNVITIEMAPFAANSKRPVKVDVMACGVPNEFSYASSERTIMRIPIQGSRSKTECTVSIKIPNATSPKALGHSADGRILGIALYSVGFE